MKYLFILFKELLGTLRQNGVVIFTRTRPLERTGPYLYILSAFLFNCLERNMVFSLFQVLWSN